MKIKNYKWNGFGFPVIFSELPAIKIRGEVIPDIDFTKFSDLIIKLICTDQQFALSGNQVKFIRNHFNMTLREFADFMGVTHQSVMRWEKNNKAAASMDISVDIVLRLKTLRKLNSKAAAVNCVIEKVDHLSDLKPKSDYIKNFKPIKVLSTEINI